MTNKFWSKREQVKKIRIVIKILGEYKGKETDKLRKELESWFEDYKKELGGKD